MNIKYLFFSFFAIILITGSAIAQISTEQAEIEPCGHDKIGQAELIKEAETNGFLVRRTEISGSTYTRHRDFQRRMAFVEGDIFTREKLEKSVVSVARMKMIYPIQLSEVGLHLDRESRDVDLVFCVKQKPRR